MIREIKLMSFGKWSLNVKAMSYYVQFIGKFVFLVSIAHTQLVMSKLQLSSSCGYEYFTTFNTSLNTDALKRTSSDFLPSACSPIS